MTKLQCFCILAMIALASGCSWFTDEEEDTRQPAELTAIDIEVSLQRLWSNNIGRGAEDKQIKLLPGHSGSRVFAASADGTVKAIDFGTGRTIWEVNIEDFYSEAERLVAFSDSTDSITGGTGVGDDLVMVGSAAGEVLAIHQADGTLAWRAVTSSEILSPPQADSGIVVAQTIDGKVAAFDSQSGERKWIYSTSTPSLTLRGTSTVILGDYVIAGFSNGRISVLDKARGLAVIDQRVAAPQGKSDLERLVDIDGIMIQRGAQLFVVSYQGNLMMIDLTRQGRHQMLKETSSAVGLGSGFGNIYLATADSEISAINMDTGKEAWETSALLYRDVTTPVAISSYLAIGDFEGYLHLMAQSDGRFVGREKIDKEGLTSQVVVDGSRIYIMGNSGRLSAYEIRQ